MKDTRNIHVKYPSLYRNLIVIISKSRLEQISKRECNTLDFELYL